jgi:pimeloyl-ACP methyl ester carboxylesterase
MQAQEKADIPGFQSAYAEVNGVRIHYWLGGDPNGLPVLLWHGFLGTSFTWHKVMPLLSAAGYAVLTPDIWGFGQARRERGLRRPCSGGGVPRAGASSRFRYGKAARTGGI